MTRHIIEPTETRSAGFSGDGQTTLTHPAYGQVSIHHVSGSADLYGSDFTHQHFVTLTIKTSELKRDLARDWHFERGTEIEIALSEAQYATMVSTPNTSGVPCTILYRRTGDLEIVPGLPRRDSTHIHNDEFREKLLKTVAALKAQRDEVTAATSKLSKKMQAEVLQPIERAIMEIESNIPFLVTSFDEHIETNIEKAKVEVNAYVTSTIVRAGLTALGAPPILPLGSPSLSRPNLSTPEK